MAGRADLQVDVALVGRTGGECVPAGAHHAHFVVSGMDLLFHDGPGPLSENVYFSGLPSIQQLAAPAELEQEDAGDAEVLDEGLTFWFLRFSSASCAYSCRHLT